jgi:hypothetical protein
MIEGDFLMLEAVYIPHVFDFEHVSAIGIFGARNVETFKKLSLSPV